VEHSTRLGHQYLDRPNPLGAFGARPPVPLSDGLDTRPCKILDPPLIRSSNVGQKVDVFPSLSHFFCKRGTEFTAAVV